jgi:hypothetical protein
MICVLCAYQESCTQDRGSRHDPAFRETWVPDHGLQSLQHHEINNCSPLYCRIARIKAVGIGVGVSWRPVPSHGRHHADKRRPTSSMVFCAWSEKCSVFFQNDTFRSNRFSCLTMHYEASIVTQGTLYQGRDGNGIE